MLLYRYPPKMSVHEKRIAKLNAENEARGIRKKSFINILLAASMLFLGYFSGKPLVMVLVSVVAAYTAFLGFALLRLSDSYNEELYTEIYDDRLVHTQRSLFCRKNKRFCIYYKDIEKSFQDKIGSLVILMNGEEKKAVLKFSVADGKYFLMREMKDKIRYISNKPPALTEWE